MVKRPMEIKKPKGTWLSRPLPETGQKKPYFIITAMLYLCNAIHTGETYKQKILALIKKNPEIPIFRLGFLDHWKDEPIWCE